VESGGPSVVKVGVFDVASPRLYPPLVSVKE
jgi:hypothetical protein